MPRPDVTQTPAAPQAARSTSTASYVPPSSEPVGHLTISDGRTLTPNVPIVIGRRPPPDPIAGQEPHLVTVEDKMLSRHHATLRVVDGRLVVVDEGSTNGTVVDAPCESPVRCEAGRPVEVPVGATVDVGGVLSLKHQRGPAPC
jgi:pSer/pThr/pTyr-binding forkhead associated (FHA) protein